MAVFDTLENLSPLSPYYKIHFSRQSWEDKDILQFYSLQILISIYLNTLVAVLQKIPYFRNVNFRFLQSFFYWVFGVPQAFANIILYSVFDALSDGIG